MRRRNQQGDSLELFLDTICNTFGGILFIALLVVVLMQISGRDMTGGDANEPVNEVEYIQSENDLAELRNELASLKKASDEFTRQNEELTTPELRKTVEKWTLAKQKNEELLREKESKITVQLAANKKVNVVLTEWTALQKTLNEKKKILEKTEKQFERTVSRKAEQELLPQFRPSDKAEIVILIRFDRFYLWHRYDAGGVRLGLNTDDMLLLEELPEGFLTIPNAAKGIDLSVEDANAQIGKILQRFSSKKFKLVFLVWPDSFGSYKKVRDWAIANNFDYAPLPATEGDIWADRGGTGKDVQ